MSTAARSTQRIVRPHCESVLLFARCVEGMAGTIANLPTVKPLYFCSHCHWQPRAPHHRYFSRRKLELCSRSHTTSLSAVTERTHRSEHAPRTSLGPRVRAEISYIMVKPDGVQRGLVGEIIGRFERKGFTLKGLRMFRPSRELAEEHYKDLSSKPFFKDLVDYITSGPVVAMVWEGDGVVASARKLIGATNPLNAEPGTIRGDLAVQTGRNVLHGSDSPENGERETALWFGADAVVDWEPALKSWLRE